MDKLQNEMKASANSRLTTTRSNNFEQEYKSTGALSRRNFDSIPMRYIYILKGHKWKLLKVERLTNRTEENKYVNRQATDLYLWFHLQFFLFVNCVAFVFGRKLFSTQKFNSRKLDSHTEEEDWPKKQWILKGMQTNIRSSITQS